MKQDRIYAARKASVDAFRFDGTVADVFEDMIGRSVPGYALILDLIGQLAGKYGLPGTNCYDLGCSLGAATLMMRRHLPADCHVIGVDNSRAMVERCRANVARDHSEATIEIREADLADTEISNASLVVMNFTLQFVPVDRRAEILARIATGMVEGGALILSEKIHFDDENEQRAMAKLHEDFKRHHGYSDLEIAQKRTALEQVLVPDTESRVLERLASCGFVSTRTISRTFNFASFLALKSPDR